MRVVVVGGKGLPEQLAEAVAAAGDEVTIVHPPGHEPAPDVVGVRRLLGDATVPSVLEAAGARRCDVLIACTQSDEDNLVVSLLAKRRLEVGRVVARINDPANAWLFDETWGVDAAVSPASTLLALVREGAGPA